jgi:hypothetical protein
MDYEFFGYFSAIADAVIGFTADETVLNLVEAAPAKISAVTDSEAFLRGVSLAQLVSAVFSAAFAMVLGYAVLKKRGLTAVAAAVPAASAGPAAVPATAAGPLRARWSEVVAHLDSPREADWKVALLEADKLVDDALARAGFPGDTFGDRLTNIRPGTLVSLDGVWWAHRIRNRLAHETDYFLRYTEARQAVGYYEQALTELQLL